MARSDYSRRFSVITVGLAGFLRETSTTWEMRLVASTDLSTVKTSTTPTMVRAACSRSTDCRCGQQLDLGVRVHCPRCGRALTRH